MHVAGDQVVVLNAIVPSTNPSTTQKQLLSSNNHYEYLTIPIHPYLHRPFHLTQ